MVHLFLDDNVAAGAYQGWVHDWHITGAQKANIFINFVARHGRWGGQPKPSANGAGRPEHV